jgi:hypothetical protein
VELHEAADPAATAPDQTRFFMMAAGVDAASKRRASTRRAFVALLILAAAAALAYLAFTSNAVRALVGAPPRQQPEVQVLSVANAPKDSAVRRVLLGQPEPGAAVVPAAPASAPAPDAAKRPARPATPREDTVRADRVEAEGIVSEPMTGTVKEEAAPQVEEPAGPVRSGSLTPAAAPAKVALVGDVSTGAGLPRPADRTLAKGESRVDGLQARSAPGSEPEPAVGSGERSPAELEQVVKRNYGGLTYCYERALKREPGLRGKILFDVTIQPSGRVSRVDLATPAFAGTDVSKCMVQKIEQWRFPPSGGEQTLQVPFLLSATY